VFGERWAHRIVAGGRQVALVEDQVDDAQHTRQAIGQLVAVGDPVGDGGQPDLAFRPQFARSPPDEERTGDLAVVSLPTVRSVSVICASAPTPATGEQQAETTSSMPDRHARLFRRHGVGQRDGRLLSVSRVPADPIDRSTARPSTATPRVNREPGSPVLAAQERAAERLLQCRCPTSRMRASTRPVDCRTSRRPQQSPGYMPSEVPSPAPSILPVRASGPALRARSPLHV
jgi:hypothetical protein